MPPAVVAGQAAHHVPTGTAAAVASKPMVKRGARAVGDAGGDVAAQDVGAEQVATEAAAENGRSTRRNGLPGKSTGAAAAVITTTGGCQPSTPGRLRAKRRQKRLIR